MEVQHFQAHYKNFDGLMKKENLSALTCKNYLADLSMFLQYLEATQAMSVSIPTLLRYKEYLKKLKFSDNAIRRSFQSLRRFLGVLQQKKLIDENYALAIPSAPKKLDPPNPPSLQVLMNTWYLLTKIEKENPLIGLRNKMLFLFIYWGGAKVSNLTLLSWAHLHLVATPRILLQEKNKEAKDPWSVPMPEIFLPITLKYKKIMEKEGIPTGKKDCVLFGANAHGYLAPFLSDRGIQLIFEQWSQELGHELIPRHLRHAAICRWFQQGHSSAQVLEWMGVSKDYPIRGFRDLDVGHEYAQFDALIS